MLFFLLKQALSLLVDLIWMSHRDDRDKAIEILLLRQQLRILQRKHLQSPRISRWEKLTLLVAPNAGVDNSSPLPHAPPRRVTP